MPATGSDSDVVSAGAVVFGSKGTVLLVHRPKYDDWSFPKGKLDPGEHAVSAAVREVSEETGVHVRLGAPLADQRYPIRGGHKRVHYWVGRPVGSTDVSTYRPNAEIDDVAWVRVDEAPSWLTYQIDLETLDEAARQRRKTRTLVVLRHAKARSRKTWRGDDRRRPLIALGREQAQRLVPVLAAYDVRRIVTSSSARCVETVAPYADTTGWPLELEDRLSEEEAAERPVEGLVGGLVGDLFAAPASAGGLVVCSHRPVLPWICAGAGVRDPSLEIAELLVLHLRRGRAVASERHRAR